MSKIAVQKPRTCLTMVAGPLDMLVLPFEARLTRYYISTNYILINISIFNRAEIQGKMHAQNLKILPKRS